MLSQWLSEVGYPATGWWMLEANRISGLAIGDAAGFTVDYIESAFYNGASIVILYVANLDSDPAWAFFNSNGDPIGSLAIAGAEIQRLQAPISVMLAQK